MTTYHNKLELYNSSAYRMLYQGDDPNSFVLRLATLQNENQAQFEKLDGIANRLMFIEQLKYVSRHNHISRDLLISYEYNIDRLCAHLGTTCVEIAATKEHYPFHAWLKRKLKLKIRPANMDDAISDLLHTSSQIETETKLSKWITTLYNDDYLDEAGLNRAFKRLFNSLPEWLAVWLSEIYVINEGSIEAIHIKWLQVPFRERCGKIANYFYEQVRNSYTHTVQYFPTMENEGTVSVLVGENRYSFNCFRYKKEKGKAELFIGLKEGFAESDVIRLIVIYILRTWLGITDDKRFFDYYWNTNNNRKLLYDLLNEIYSNFKIIEQWATFHLHEEDFSAYNDITKLSNSVVKIAINHLNDFGLEPIDFELQNYLHSTEVINNEIINFENDLQHIECEQPHEIEVFIRNLIRHTQLKGVLRHMKSTETFICHVLKMPMRFESGSF